MEGGLKVSQISFVVAVISLFTLSTIATLVIATPWLISPAVLLMSCYAFGEKESKERIDILRYLISNTKENSEKLEKNKKPRLINSSDDKSNCLN